MASSVGFFGDYRAQWVKHPIPSTVITVLAVALITLGALSYARIQPFHSLHSVNGSIAMWSAGAVLLLLPFIVSSIKINKEKIQNIEDERPKIESPSDDKQKTKPRTTNFLNLAEAEQFASQLGEYQYFRFGIQMTDYIEDARNQLIKLGNPQPNTAEIQQLAYDIWYENPLKSLFKVKVRGDGIVEEHLETDWHNRCSHWNIYSMCVLENGVLKPISNQRL